MAVVPNNVLINYIWWEGVRTGCDSYYVCSDCKYYSILTIIKLGEASFEPPGSRAVGLLEAANI